MTERTQTVSPHPLKARPCGHCGCLLGLHRSVSNGRTTEWYECHAPGCFCTHGTRPITPDDLAHVTTTAINAVADVKDAEIERLRNALTTDRLAIACYLLDRADQYPTDKPMWIALTDRIASIVNGEARAMFDRGETSDLIERVQKIAGPRRGTST